MSGNFTKILSKLQHSIHFPVHFQCMEWINVASGSSYIKYSFLMSSSIYSQTFFTLQSRIIATILINKTKRIDFFIPSHETYKETNLRKWLHTSMVRSKP